MVATATATPASCRVLRIVSVIVDSIVAVPPGDVLVIGW
jgi:hypothetical protein